MLQRKNFAITTVAAACVVLASACYLRGEQPCAARVSIGQSSDVCGEGTTTGQAKSKPNIVFILVDDMGYGDPGCYNAESKIPTPHIDSLAREGMRFTDAHAAGPLCHVSRYGLLTGRYPFRVRVNWGRGPVIQAGDTTIASMLKDQGYRTAMVGKWHLGFDEQNGYDQPLPGGPVDRGFDSFFGIRASTDIPPYFYIRNDQAVEPPTKDVAANHTDGWTNIQGAFWRAGKIAPNLKLKDVLPRFTDEAVTVIQDHAEEQSSATEKRPLFLYLAYPAPHTPWLPADEFADVSGAGMYGDFAAMLDTMLGHVLAELAAHDMADDTVVLFSSDNGPVWYDDDVNRLGHDSSGGLRGMKADAWEGGHRMPFIVRWPGNVAPGSVSDQLIGFTDVMATLATISGAQLPGDAGPDSIDFSPVLLGTSADKPLRKSLVVQSGNGMMTIREGKWKLINALGSGGFSQPKRVQPGPNDPAGQLYDLSQDLGETQNLYTERPDVVERMLRQLESVTAEDGRSKR